MSTTHSELRLASLLDERETVVKLHEAVIASVETNEDKLPTESQGQMIRGYREKEIALDEEITALTEDIERNRRAIESSKAVRRILAGGSGGVEVTEDGVAYRDFYTYARDVALTSSRSLAQQWANGDDEIAGMRERLELAKRTPANTLSSDVPGLQPAQHIAQIMQVIDKSRPLVASARKFPLERGQLTYPVVTQRPVVAVQTSEKTEAGNQKMIIDSETANASVYLGGGDISWQAANWSSPDAIAMWFDLAAEDYAIKTEEDAAQVLQHSAFSYNIDSGLLGSTPTYADFMEAIGAGGAEVFANSRRMADTVYLAVDRWWYLFGTTSAATTQFTTVNVDGVGPLRFVASPGLDDGVIIVGASQGLFVAETPGAPVELRVVEPAIGGYEVGIIGGFEAVVGDPGSFAMVTTAS